MNQVYWEKCNLLRNIMKYLNFCVFSDIIIFIAVFLIYYDACGKKFQRRLNIESNISEIQVPEVLAGVF
jgi:hypothetical protein